MSDTSKNEFHEFSLKSALFKGRPDLYFCYLKSEKIAHALAHLLGGFIDADRSVSETLLNSSAFLPASVVRFAAGELDESAVLVDVFELLSLVRLAVSHDFLDERTAAILVHEYEVIAEKISLGKNASPFLALEDLAVPPFGAREGAGRALPALEAGHKGHIKDTQRQSKGHITKSAASNPASRSAAILKIVLENKRVSIKDISKIIRNCSEKTIQRELSSLIQQGLVQKEGERRWSVYVPVARD